MATLALVLLALLPAAFGFDGYDFVLNTDPKISYNTPRALLSKQDGGRFSQLPASAFTFCFYVYVANVHGEEPTLVSYSSMDAYLPNELYLEAAYVSASYTALTIHGGKAIFDKTPDMDEWTHVCCSWSSSSGKVQLFFNGKEIPGGTPELQKGFTIGGDGYFVWGQDQDDYNGYYDATQGVRGRMTQFHLWDRQLTGDEVNEVMNNTRSGEVIAWSNSSWQFSDGIMIEKTTAPVFTSPCGGVKQTPCKNVLNTYTSTYDLKTGFEDGLPKLVTATLKDDVFREMKQFTICMALYNRIPGYVYEAFTYTSDSGEPMITIGFESTPLKMYYAVGNKSSSESLRFKQGFTFDFCVTWSSATGDYELYFKDTRLGAYRDVNKNYVIPGNGQLVINQEQFAPLIPETPNVGFKHKTTGFYMWDRKLTEEEVVAFHKCTGSVKGAVVDPSHSEWEVTTRGCPPHSEVSPIESNDPSDFQTNAKIRLTIYNEIYNDDNTSDMQTFSCSFWVYSESDQPVVEQFIITSAVKISLNKTLEVSVNGITAEFPDYPISARSWQHICLTWSGVDGGTTQLFLDGQKKGTVTNIASGQKVSTLLRLKSVNVQYGAADKEDPKKGFYWKVTDVNVWDSVLPDEEVEKAYQCSLVQGNVLNAHASSWQKQ